MNICIDPGHSGIVEPGACASDGKITEAKINMDVSFLLKEELIKDGHTVILTRYGDIDNDGLLFRSAIANDSCADIFVSIHCNSASNTGANGTETYFLTEDGCRESKALATRINNHIVQAIKTRNRGIKTANFSVLRETAMPAVLVELGFISNDAEREKLINPETQKDYAIAIRAGILAWEQEYSS
jgi:N-acetylmuramoyl-L-alanine amidase